MASPGNQRIDIHTHLDTPGPEPSAEELATALRLARRHEIGRIVLLGNIVVMGGPDPKPEDIGAINTHTLRAVALQPDFCIGFCYLNPAHPANFIREEMERCLVQGGMKGIKLWIAVKATDARLEPIMARAQEMDVPVLHHAWYKNTEYAFNESTPAEVAALARRFPKVALIMAHLTGVGSRGVMDIAETPNVLVDTSGGQPETGGVEYAVRRLGAQRVIYGSDWPIRDFGTQTGRILGAKITEEERELIFRGNAVRLLKLKE